MQWKDYIFILCSVSLALFVATSRRVLAFHNMWTADAFIMSLVLMHPRLKYSTLRRSLCLFIKCLLFSYLCLAVFLLHFFPSNCYLCFLINDRFVQRYWHFVRRVCVARIVQPSNWILLATGTITIFIAVNKWSFLHQSPASLSINKLISCSFGFNRFMHRAKHTHARAHRYTHWVDRSDGIRFPSCGFFFCWHPMNDLISV